MNGVFRPGETYQVTGGRRLHVVSVTPDPEAEDSLLVLQDEDGGSQDLQSVTEFNRCNPELVAAAH